MIVVAPVLHDLNPFDEFLFQTFLLDKLSLEGILIDHSTRSPGGQKYKHFIIINA